jgi:hypothetical protein
VRPHRDGCILVQASRLQNGKNSHHHAARIARVGASASYGFDEKASDALVFGVVQRWRRGIKAAVHTVRAEQTVQFGGDLRR